ncbi:MAG: C-terminal binding protein [Thermomicrobiales bacterium]
MSNQFSLVVTSDRYGSGSSPLDTERQIIDEFPDIDVKIHGSTASLEAELIDVGQNADGLMCSTREVISRTVLTQSPRIKVIAIYGVGLNNVDLDAAADLGVVVTHYPQYCTAEVSDHALSLILGMNRRVFAQNEALKQGEWVRHRAQTGDILKAAVKPLRESTLGIIGLGRIGQASAAKAKAFGLRLIAADPVPDHAAFERLGVELVPLDQLLEESDLITIHCPLLPSTRKLIDAAALTRTKSDVVIVNTARGPIIDLDALVAELQANPSKRAALDVTDPEPLPLEHPLYSMDNVVLTPHSAYYSERSVEIVRRETLVDAIAVLRGIRPRTVANPAVLNKVSLRDWPA